MDSFPPHQQAQVRSKLSFTLQAVFTQHLLLKSGGVGRILACEVLIVTPAIKNLIRDMKTEQVYLAMQTGAKFGMQTMNTSLFDLVTRNQITYQEAMEITSDADDLKRLLQKSNVG